MSNIHIESINNVAFKVLDVRNKGKKSDEVEINVEMKKDNNQGVASLNILGPSKKKGCTIMVTNLKKHDMKFVEMLAWSVIKELLDYFNSEDGWINFFLADNKPQFPLTPMGVLATGSMHASLSAWPPTKMSKNLSAHVSSKLHWNISPKNSYANFQNHKATFDVFF